MDGDGRRLVETHHLYPGPDGEWRLAGPGDTVERLRVPPKVGAALERLLCGRVSHDGAAVEAGGPDVLDRALAAFEARGLLASAPAVAASTPDGGPVAVLGTGRVAAQVAELVAASGRAVRRSADGGGDLDGAAVVLACASTLPDTRWQELDDACRHAGLAWHRYHREGGRHVVGPFTVPRRTASYRDTRARRLAAARHPTELAAAWRYLDRHHLPWPESAPAIGAVVAGILATDTSAYLEHRPIPTAGHQLVIHPDTLVVDRHPVLPLPAAAVDGWAGEDATERA